MQVTSARAAEPTESRFVDHSLLIAPEYPCTWPAFPFPRFQITHQRTIGRDSAYNIDVLLIDGNTGTQLDVPPHSVARPELKREKSGPLGLAYTDKIEPWQFGGEACVVDVLDLLDQAPKGVSPLVKAEHVQRFEKQHRPLRFGDVVLFRSDYSDKYYRPFPDGPPVPRRRARSQGTGLSRPRSGLHGVPRDPGRDDAGDRQRQHGSLAGPRRADALRGAEARHDLGRERDEPRRAAPVGGFFCLLAPKHEGGPYSEARAFSIVGGELPQRLIESCKQKRAIDLSPTLSPRMPVTSPGSGAGEHRQSYLKIDFLYSEPLDMWHHAHLMDAMAGTHLVPPAFALPAPGTEPAYATEVLGSLADYERKYGPRGTSEMTTEKVPLSWTCGPVRVIDVRSLVGTTARASWPASPEITPAHIQAAERAGGELKPGEIVVFHTGHLDRHLHPQPAGHGRLGRSPDGKERGLAGPRARRDRLSEEQGHPLRRHRRARPRRRRSQTRLMTYWALGSREMVGVEFLQNVGRVPAGGYFLFAALKIRDCHGGPGRAIVLY